MSHVLIRHYRTLSALLLGLGLLAMLLPLPVVQAQDGKAEVALVWPTPPETARIRFVKAIATPEDAGRSKGFWRRLMEFIRGPEDELIRKPMAVAATAKRIYVADPAGKRIHVYERKDGDYSLIEDAGEQRLRAPMGVAADPEDRVYVVDSEHRRIFVLDDEGRLLRSYGNDAQLTRPTAAAVDWPRRRLYVADTPAHAVQVFSLTDGALLMTVGQHGNMDGEFNYPSYLAVDGAGQLYVTDGLNGRIQVFDGEGRFVRSIGQRGDGSGDFTAPKGVGVDSEGHVYVADAAFDNVQIFDGEGHLLLAVGSSGQGAGQFWMPTGLYIDGRDQIFVADSYNNRIQVFQYLPQGRTP